MSTNYLLAAYTYCAITVSNSNNRKNDEQKSFINMIIIINKRKGREKRTAGIWRDGVQANQKTEFKHNSQSLFAYTLKLIHIHTHHDVLANDANEWKRK